MLWTAPALLGGETVIAGTTAATCPTGSTAPSNIAEEMACAGDEVKNSVLILVDIFKYVLLVAAIDSVAVLRVGRAAAAGAD